MFGLLLVAIFIGAFAIGSIPFHRIVGLKDKDDPTEKHCRCRSVLRVFLNVFKGFGIVTFGCIFGPEGGLAALYGVTFGHNYPFWSTFRGGTGLGTILGALLGRRFLQT